MSAPQATRTRPDAERIGSASAAEILAQLELHVSRSRALPRDPASTPLTEGGARSDTILPSSRLPPRGVAHESHPLPFELLPFELLASAVGCTLTIVAYALLAAPLAVAVALGLAATGESLRRRCWRPPAGVSLIFGTAIGILIVLTA